MPSRIETRLQELGLELPAAPAPAANYVPWALSGKTVYISGQLPVRHGRVAVTGRLGESLALEQGQEAARLCGLNLLAQLRAACGGDLDRAARCLKLGGFVCAAAGFVDHAQVVNGASDLIYAVMGEGGRHTRIAVGVGTLPLDAAVEVDAIFELA